MNRAIAFLRAINVGGHTVKMDFLRALFDQLGFVHVETFIASGNVIFDTPEKISAGLEGQIEQHLSRALGYEVNTFLRTPAEVAESIRLQPFDDKRLSQSGALNVAFLHSPLNASSLALLKQLETGIDEFETVGREVFWLCQVRQSESKFSNAVLERTLKEKSTLRGFNTLKRLADLYPPV